jgi:D-galacturonate reductase
VSTVNLIIVGAGEYITGLGPAGATGSDKPAGIVALAAFELRRCGKVGRIGICARDGSRFEKVRRHFAERIGKPYGLDTSFEPFPSEARIVTEPLAEALPRFAAGDAVIIFTPDDTHFPIALAAVEHGCHVFVAKPLVLTLAQHLALECAARARGVLIAIDMHKRWDPIYADARERARSLGDFSFLSSYMSQPKSQLETFRAWAGLSSDISYYLNAHHIDMHAWIMQGHGRPVRVTAAAAAGVAAKVLGRPVEDTISLHVEWENLPSGNRGVASYTASWIAPPSDVHSQQRFFYQGHHGELTVDQAHRGYSVATDEVGLSSPNPLFMRYTPVAGQFAAHASYGYLSIEAFVDAVQAIRAGERTPNSPGETMAHAASTRQVTAILEAGRVSLNRRAPVEIAYDERAPLDPVSIGI